MFDDELVIEEIAEFDDEYEYGLEVLLLPPPKICDIRRVALVDKARIITTTTITIVAIVDMLLWTLL